MSRYRVKKTPARATLVPQWLTASRALKHLNASGLGLNFNHGVAIWLPGLREMTNNVLQFLNLRAKHHKYVSRCYKFRLRTQVIGMIYLFRNRKRATRFRSSLSEGVSSPGDYLFVKQNMGTYLKAVAKIEDGLKGARPDDDSNGDTKVIIRNTLPRDRVTKKVLRLCAIFGNVTGYQVFDDKGKCFHFRHIAVSYRFATQAFAAKLGLDSKWIPEQNRPLGADVERNEKVVAIYKELLRRDNLIFQP